MRMFSRFKFMSRAVHEEKITYPRINRTGNLCTHLTVWRKSLIMSCKGFTVIDSYGNLVYRVDNYIGRPNEVVLMDASGNSIFTMCRRTVLGLLESWFVYEGEVGNNLKQRPIWCVRKHVNILQGNPHVQAHVYLGSSRFAAFTVEGSYAHRTCEVLDECRRVVAEIKRKEANSKDVSFGIEIFQLIVHPAFDPAFAMALVLLLDQMFS